jgi:cobalt-zinc-cadmium efflux system protein
MAALLHGGHQHDLNRRAALMHVLGDALGSVGALVAGGLVLTMGWGWADPVASLCIALIIAVGAWRILKEATEVLMMAAPREISFESVREVMLAEPGVFAVHDLHLWSLAPGAPVLSAHIVVNEEAVAPIVRRRLEDRLRTVLHFEHLTIQVEQNGDMCRCCPTDEVPRPEAAR